MFNAVANEVRSNAAAVVSIDSGAAARVGTAKASLKKESIATLCIRRNILKSIPPDFDKDFLDLLANWKSCQKTITYPRFLLLTLFRLH